VTITDTYSCLHIRFKSNTGKLPSFDFFGHLFSSLINFIANRGNNRDRVNSSNEIIDKPNFYNKV
jgi:hypothetical protein